MKTSVHILNFLYLIVCGFLLNSCSNDNKGGEAETTISYTITISPDLLKFVTPQVSYIDENGVLVTITGIEDLDNKVLENKAELSNGGSSAKVWSKTVISGTGFKCWTVKMKFKRLNFHSYMAVKYIRNDFIEDTTGKKYEFHHNVNTDIIVLKISDSDVSAFSDSHVSIATGNYKQGDDIESYINNLCKFPDKVGYFIDADGNAARRDEFDL